MIDGILGFVRALPAHVLAVTQEVGTGNMIILFGLMASLVTPLVLTARRMDKR